MDPTFGLGEKLRDIVLNVIWENLLYLICYGQNVEKLKEELVLLTNERNSIQLRIDAATNNVEQSLDNVKHWLGEVQTISEQVEQLHKESQSKRECTITSCPNPWMRYKLSKRAKAMAQQVAAIHKRANFPVVSIRGPPPPMLELPTGVSNEGIDSRVQIKSQIIEALRDPSVKVVGLCGLGGVGKTTIAKEVARNQNMFDKVIMATVSQELNIEKIQSQIAEKLGMQLIETDKDVRASRLYERLQQEKNMLLILDDLWEELDLRQVGIPFFDVESFSKQNESEQNEGCKLVLISRHKALLLYIMKCKKTIDVGVLSENEAWELFKRISELSIDSTNPELIPIATEIVQMFAGLPLAITTAAKALRKKDVISYRDALGQLKKSGRDITAIDEMVPIVRLSYDPLRSEKKHIFLLAAMLSHDILIEDLLMYSMGLDILEAIDNMEDAHDRISTIVDELKSSNLFLDSFSSQHVTIHDVFRHVALLIASKELPAFTRRRLKEWPDENTLKGCKRICLQESEINDLPEELNGPELESFMLNSTKLDLTIPSRFFKSLKHLKLLAFSNVRFSSLQLLSFLQNLKALFLHSCLLEDITEVRSLKKLKILSLAYSKIQRLPVELAELTSLQMLNLSHCTNLKVIPEKLLSSLKKLEGLFMGSSFNQWKVEESNEADENASLDELMEFPEISSLDIHIPDVSMLPENLFLDMKLQRYKIFIGTHWEWQDHFECSKILKLDLESSTHLTGGIPKLFEGVESLYLYGANALESGLHIYDGRGFLHLRNLHVESNTSNIISGTLFNNKVLLPKLEMLELSNLNSWISLIWDYQISHNSFNNLKKLIVKRCGIVKLVPFHVLKSLNNLEEVEVQNCDMLETVFNFEDLNDYEKIVSSSVVVPLKKLKLWCLPKLKNVWSNHYCQGNVSFPSLRSVDVSFCESLTSIFPASIAKDVLRDLEELSIKYCGINVIVAKDLVSESVTVTFEFLKLTSLRLACLSKLRSFYPHKHTLELSHLQELSIECCDELEIFEKEVSSSSGTQEEETTIDSMYPLLSHEKVIRTLEKLILRGKQVEMIGSGQFQMYHSPKLKQLCLSVLKSEHFLVIPSDLGWLQLSGDFEEALGGDNVAALVAPFSKLEVGHVSKLSPSLVSSSTLTHLSVKRCYGLTTLMTSSIARSLTHLMHLSVGYCKEMEEIITMQEGEDDENKEIIFNKLKFLELRSLPKLKRFCAHCYTFKFSLLDQLIIEECPKFIIFSPGVIDTPYHISVQPWQDREKHHEIWDSDLNKLK